MRKTFSRIITTALAIALFCGATPALAADTQDKAFSFTISSAYRHTDYRDKEDSTPVYVYYKIGTYGSLRATAMGWLETDDADLAAFPKNRTLNGPAGEYVDYVYVMKGIQTSIHTYLYETSCYHDVHVEMKSYDGFSSDTVSGVWSPDSTRTYTSAYA